MIGTILLIIATALVIYFSAHDSITILTGFNIKRWRKKQEYRKTVLHEMATMAKMLWIAEFALFVVIAILSKIWKISFFAFYLYLVLAIAWTILAIIATVNHGNMPPDRPVGSFRSKTFSTGEPKE